MSASHAGSPLQLLCASMEANTSPASEPIACSFASCARAFPPASSEAAGDHFACFIIILKSCIYS